MSNYEVVMVENPLKTYVWSFHDDHSVIWQDFDMQRSSMMVALLILLNENMALPSLDYIKYKRFI